MNLNAISANGPSGDKVATVLLSGGMDSMACLHMCKASGAPVQALFLDYGQRAAHREEEAVRHIAQHFQVPWSVIRLRGSSPLAAGSGFVQGRNMTLLMLGLMHAGTARGSLVLGIHNGTPYCDCTPQFVAEAQRVFDLYTGGEFRVEAPFVHLNKVDIAIYCLEHRLPIQLTYSCELGLDQPCGRCRSCRDLVALDGELLD